MFDENEARDRMQAAPDACPECGSRYSCGTDCALLEGRETDCGICGEQWARWVPSVDGWRCSGCAPLATIHDRCARGDR